MRATMIGATSATKHLCVQLFGQGALLHVGKTLALGISLTSVKEIVELANVLVIIDFEIYDFVTALEKEAAAGSRDFCAISASCPNFFC